MATSLLLGSEPWTSLLGSGLDQAQRARLVFQVAVAGLASLALLVLARRGARGGSLVAVIAAGATVACLAIAHARLNPTGPREIFSLRPAPLAALGDPAQARIWVYDYFDGGAAPRYLHRQDPLVIATRPRGWSAEQTAALAMRNYLLPPSAGIWGVRGSFDGDFSQVYPRGLDALVRLARRLEGTPAGLRLLRLGSVTHVLALHDVSGFGLEAIATEPSFLPEPIRVFRVPDPLPRVRLVGQAWAARGAQLEERLASETFDPVREVVLDADVLPAAAEEGAFGSAEIVEERPDYLRIATQSTAPGWLVEADTWDAGWRARVDGGRVPLLRANLAFRAVAVPAGSHVVELRFRPASVVVGAAVSAVAWGLVLLAGASRALTLVRARLR